MCGGYQTCPKVPNFSKNHQTECYFSPNPSKYTCINRMDKYYQDDEIFTKSLYSEEPLKLNKDFNFNISGILCTNDNWRPVFLYIFHENFVPGFLYTLKGRFLYMVFEILDFCTFSEQNFVHYLMTENLSITQSYLTKPNLRSLAPAGANLHHLDAMF